MSMSSQNTDMSPVSHFMNAPSMINTSTYVPILEKLLDNYALNAYLKIDIKATAAVILRGYLHECQEERKVLWATWRKQRIVSLRVLTHASILQINTSKVLMFLFL